MLNKKISEMLTAQINRELFSAYLYLEFSNYYYDQGLDGFGNWFDIQAQEERDHAMLLRQYMLNNGERVVFEAIEKPEKEYKDLISALEMSLEHERYITANINAIYKAADELSDYRTMQCLDWFVKEQGEEEKNAEDLIRKYTLFGRDGKGLYALDKELQARVYTAPSLVL